MSDTVSKYYEKLEDKAHWARIAKEEAERKAKEEESISFRVKHFFSLLFNI